MTLTWCNLLQNFVYLTAWPVLRIQVTATIVEIHNLGCQKRASPNTKYPERVCAAKT